MHDPEEITYFGETDSRSRRVRFGIRADDRTKHMYVIGKSGMGKSTLLENMAVQDIQNGNGFCFLDPHGGSAELLMAYIPEERKKDVLYIAPFDTENPIGFNILENMGADKRHLVVSGIMSVFKKLWVDQWSARMEYFLQNALFALLEYPEATLLHVNRMFSDKAFRDEVITHITDSAIKDFWTNEWANMTERFIAEATPAIQNKIGQFAANPVLRNILGQPKSTFNFRKLMDERKIVIVNLAKGLMGEANTDLIGSLLVTKLYLAAMSRADVGKFEIDNLPNFYLYVDEFQSFSNDSFANILSEARKYKLNLTIAHQYVEQMEETVAAAVFGNVGTTVTFRVGATDADALEKEFAPVFEAADLVGLGKYQIYLKLMIDGVGSVPFSATTLPPLPKPEIDLTNEVIELSRAKYSTSKSVVEKNIQDTVFFDFKTKNQGKGGGGQNKSGGKSNNGSQNKSSAQGNNGSQKKGGAPSDNGGQNKSDGGRELTKKVDSRSDSGSRPKPPQTIQQSMRSQSQPSGSSTKLEQSKSQKIQKPQENSQDRQRQKPKEVLRSNHQKPQEAPQEKPEPPLLSHATEKENPFKIALKHETFTRSMREKTSYDRKEEKKQETTPQKVYNKNKETVPERRNTLQEALAALKPRQESSSLHKSSEKNHVTGHVSSDKKKEKVKDKKTDGDTSNEHKQGQNRAHTQANKPQSKEHNSNRDQEPDQKKGSPEGGVEEASRNVKVPAHISDEQLQNLLKITEKDLELNT